MPPGLRVAGGFRSITPDRILPMAGFHLRPPPTGEVEAELEANAVVLREGARVLCLVQVDALSAGFRLRRDILRSSPGLAEDQLLLCASHTHFAPNLDPDLGTLGSLDEGHYERVRAIVTSLVRELLGKTGRAVEVTWGSAPCAGGVNRRKRCWEPQSKVPFLRRRTLTLPDSRGPLDRRLRLIQWRGREGDPAAFLWNYACHPVGYPGLEQVSPEYVGVVRRRVRRMTNGGMPVLFLPGFMGDVRPRIEDASWGWCHTPGQYLHRLLEGPRFGTFTRRGWEVWAEGIADVAERLVKESARSEGRHGMAASERRTMAVDELMEGESSGRQFAIQSLDLAAGLRCVGASAEVLSGYDRWLESGRDGGREVVPVGYLDGVFGYLPTSRDLAEGGYEADESRAAYGLRGRYRASVESRVGQWMRERAVARTGT
jgi:hypothetical protein